MQNRELRSQLDSLTSLLDRTDDATGENIELMGHWGRYLCVLVAGFLENALTGLYSAYVGRVANEPVANYSIRRLEKIINPKASKFVEIARSFSREWGDELEAFLDDDGGRRKNAIDSIMNSRHQIVHGKITGISIVYVRAYLSDCVDVVEFIEKQLR